MDTSKLHTTSSRSFSQLGLFALKVLRNVFFSELDIYSVICYRRYGLLLSLCYAEKRSDSFSSRIFTPLAAISQPCKPYSFLIHHYVVAKAIKRVCRGCTKISSEKLDLLFFFFSSRYWSQTKGSSSGNNRKLRPEMNARQQPFLLWCSQHHRVCDRR